MVPGISENTTKSYIKIKWIFLLAFCICVNSIRAQDLIGIWHSEDSTRQYEILKSLENNYSAVIKSSVRPGDIQGFEVLRELTYNAQKNRFEGYIYTPSERIPSFVTIRISPSNPKLLLLSINSILFTRVQIRWYRTLSGTDTGMPSFEK
ncbi:MAG TPA: hypothetical protein VJ552_03550 [Sediminibacterium sp.]|nr:hypothetical protein [Sediminibacterium sp.]